MKNKEDMNQSRVPETLKKAGLNSSFLVLSSYYPLIASLIN